MGKVESGCVGDESEVGVGREDGEGGGGGDGGLDSFSGADICSG